MFLYVAVTMICVYLCTCSTYTTTYIYVQVLTDLQTCFMGKNSEVDRIYINVAANRFGVKKVLVDEFSSCLLPARNQFLLKFNVRG